MSRQSKLPNTFLRASDAVEGAAGEFLSFVAGVGWATLPGVLPERRHAVIDRPKKRISRSSPSVLCAVWFMGEESLLAR